MKSAVSERQPADRVLDRHHAALAHPVGEEVRRLARVDDLADVRAGVGEAHEHDVARDHLLDRVELLVEQRPLEHDPAVGLEAQVDERLDRRRRREPRATAARLVAGSLS